MYSDASGRFWAKTSTGMKSECGACGKNFPPSVSFNCLHLDCVSHLSEFIGGEVKIGNAVKILNEWSLPYSCTFCGGEIPPGSTVVLFHYSCLSPFWDEVDKQKATGRKNSWAESVRLKALKTEEKAISNG